MTDLFRTRTTAVWAALMAATILSWALGASHGVEGDAVETATAGVLFIAFLKVRWVGLDFMELRHTTRALRIAFEAWVVVVGSVVVALYLI